MLRKTRLFTPGPTPLLPAAQAAMATREFHHRTADFRALYTRVLEDLQMFIGTGNDVVLLASSGTGAMEATVSNLTSPGDRVLVLSAGKFGERWRELAKAFGCAVDMVSAPYGETFTTEAVREKLKEVEPRVLYMQATETSTGVRHDVAAVAKMLRGKDTLLVVDAITGLGTTELNVDGWGVDIILGGSQKALMIPPGLAYLAVSDRAWKRMESARSPRYYFDLRKERKAAELGESAYTPATSLVAALAAALDYLRTVGDGEIEEGRKALKLGESAYTPATSLVAALAAALDYLRTVGDGEIEEGRKALIANAELAAEMTQAAAAALRLKLFAAQPAAALTAIEPPAGVDSGVIVRDLRENFGAIVANGQGEMQGKLFRISHMGYYDYVDTMGMIGALEHAVARAMRPRHIEIGAGLSAAQALYARAECFIEPKKPRGRARTSDD